MFRVGFKHAIQVSESTKVAHLVTSDKMNLKVVYSNSYTGLDTTVTFIISNFDIHTKEKSNI
jgi:hypothetical protein